LKAAADYNYDYGEESGAGVGSSGSFTLDSLA
jgi:hypothetical protein